MTIQELYQKIGGDYEQAIRVLRVEKLIDKHIRKFTKNGIVEAVLKAGEDMDPVTLFETAHALKGVSANLGLSEMSRLASEIADEFRPGSTRSLSDEEITSRMQQISELYDRTADGIRQYEEG